MSQDATLDAFADERDAEVEPAAVTSSWSGDGQCGACGGSAARRWQDGEARVCAGCKPWTTGSGTRDQ